jgi:hypothetical protein
MNRGTRAPYLQVLTPYSIIVRWNTDLTEKGIVRYGVAAGKLDHSIAESEATTTHELRVQGLTPATRYYYAVEGEKSRVAGGTAQDWFVTAPHPGNESPVRFWVIGDSGQPGVNQRDVRDAAMRWLERHPRDGSRPYLDFAVALGDNAYTSGRNSEYQAGFFDPYRDLLRNIAVWPAYGNHDARRWAFFNIFTFPESGEAGGVSSGTENWYAFDYANAHFVVLDSQASDRSPDGPMLTWLKADLAASRQPWLITIFHHPPYTKGGHDSDRSRDSHGRMKEMRENALPILEAAGVDLVLTGHTHDYERSFLLDCHYGTSDQLTPGMVLDRGRAFQKPDGRKGHAGAVYVVAGSSAKLDGGKLNHPAMAVSQAMLGSMVIDISKNRLDARFINTSAQELDTFSIEKNGTEAPASVCVK